MKKITCLLSLVPCLLLCACDLNPKITALPDTVGEFISARFPTMLADPGAQPEIYNSAANDYGTYAATDVYGSNAVDEYTLYASGDDYIMPTQGAPIYGTQVSVPTTAPGVDVPDVLVVGSPSDYLTVGDRVPPPVAHSGATPPASGVGQGLQLQIVRIQSAGGKPMDWKSFVNGLRGADISIGA